MPKLSIVCKQQSKIVELRMIMNNAQMNRFNNPLILSQTYCARVKRSEIPALVFEVGICAETCGLLMV